MSLLDWIFPKTCVGCGKVGCYLCSDCSMLARRAFLICPACKQASQGGRTHKECWSDFGLDGLFVVWRFEGAIRKAISQLKFGFIRELADDLSREAVLQVFGDSRSDSFLKFVEDKAPIWIGASSLSAKEKRRELGQSGLLAELLSRDFGCNSGDKWPIKQEMNVVLVDDVWDLGGGMSVATRKLKELGAMGVWGFVVAR